MTVASAATATTKVDCACAIARLIVMLARTIFRSCWGLYTPVDTRARAIAHAIAHAIARVSGHRLCKHVLTKEGQERNKGKGGSKRSKEREQGTIEK